MTVHMIRIKAEKSVSLDKAQSVVGNWISNHLEVLKEERSGLSVANTEMDDSGIDYFRGSWRFSLEDDKQNLISEIEEDLSQVVNWYVVKYHKCNHDEDADSRGNCSWDEIEEYGDVPSEVRI